MLHYIIKTVRTNFKNTVIIFFKKKYNLSFKIICQDVKVKWLEISSLKLQ